MLQNGDRHQASYEEMQLIESKKATEKHQNLASTHQQKTVELTRDKAQSHYLPIRVECNLDANQE